MEKEGSTSLLKHKAEAFEKFQAFKSLVENESDRKIKCLRSDRGGEFTLDEFFEFCEQHGIKRQFSTSRTPQQNVVEIMNIIVQQMDRSMLDESRTPATFWGEATFVAITILNQANVGVNITQTPHELWYDVKDKCYNKRLGNFFESIDVVVDEACKNPKQIKSTEDYDNEEDLDYFPTSNQNHIEEETNEAPEEEIMVEDKTSSRKSTSGGAFYMGSKLVSWFNKKQSSIALSTAEAEYVAAASCCTQLIWMLKTLQDIKITYTPPTSILCDNTSAINISKNPVMHSKTKNIPIKYHFLREQVLEQKVKLEYVPSKEYVADIFTKPLPRETFEYLRQKLGVVAASS
eukprot:PITA_33541